MCSSVCIVIYLLFTLLLMLCILIGVVVVVSVRSSCSTRRAEPLARSHGSYLPGDVL